MNNKILINAQKAKNDEFYTQLDTVENEMNAYYEYDNNVFRDKTILCPCDDPDRSNFAKHFIEKRHQYAYKKLICTCYNKDGNGKKLVLENGVGNITALNGDGDFRGEEVKALIDEADVVITNPPFSLAKELNKILNERQKKFLLLGTINWLCEKSFGTLWIENKVWPGFLFKKNVTFNTPDGEKCVSIAWWTNIDAGQKIDPLVLTKTYTGNESNYPKYDNCDAIEVNRTADIPKDYFDVMGVPVSAAGKICREQFDVLGIMKRGINEKYVFRTKTYTKEENRNANDLNAGPVLVENGNYRTVYARILIQRKKPEEEK